MRRRGWTDTARIAGALPQKRDFARRMRKDPTAGERLLWNALRRRALDGWVFRRQHVIAGYIVDFYCPELKLVLEVDGTVHESREHDDARRDERLGALGLRVIRLDDAEVVEHMPEVLRRVAIECEERASFLRVRA